MTKHVLEFDDQTVDLMDDAWQALEEKVRGVRGQLRRAVLTRRLQEQQMIAPPDAAPAPRRLFAGRYRKER